MLTTDGQDFSRVLTDHGYRLVARDPKYLDPLVQKYGPTPAVHYPVRIATIGVPSVVGSKALPPCMGVNELVLEALCSVRPRELKRFLRSRTMRHGI
jgi:hypothetical protein